MNRLVFAVGSDDLLSIVLSYAGGEDCTLNWFGTACLDARCRHSEDALADAATAHVYSPTCWVSLTADEVIMINATAMELVAARACVTFVCGAEHIDMIRPLVAREGGPDWIVWLTPNTAHLASELMAEGAMIVNVLRVPTGNSWSERIVRGSRRRRFRESLNPILCLLFGPVYIPSHAN